MTTETAYDLSASCPQFFRLCVQKVGVDLIETATQTHLVRLAGMVLFGFLLLGQMTLAICNNSSHVS